MKRTRFTKPEAEALVGRSIRTLRAWSDVPVGTAGRIVGIEDLGVTAGSAGADPDQRYDVIVEWQINEAFPLIGGKPLRDCFTKDKYETYLEALPGEDGQGDSPADSKTNRIAELTSLIENLIGQLDDAHEHLMLAEASIDVEYTRDTLTECRQRISEASLRARCILEHWPRRLIGP